MPKCCLHWLCTHVSLENMRIEGRRANWNSNVPGETVVCDLFRANWNGSSRYSPLVSATIFGPRRHAATSTVALHSLATPREIRGLDNLAVHNRQSEA